MAAREKHDAEHFILRRKKGAKQQLTTLKMDKKTGEIFGKFQKQKVDTLSSIKGGVMVSDSKTTLCQTSESTFDSDSQAGQENLGDKRCEA